MPSAVTTDAVTSSGNNLDQADHLNQGCETGVDQNVPPVEQQEGREEVSKSSNILFDSASEAKICTCPPGTCQKGGPGCCANCPGALDVCEPGSPAAQHASSGNEMLNDQVVPMNPGRVFVLPHSMCCASPASYSNQFNVSCPIANH